MVNILHCSERKEYVCDCGKILKHEKFTGTFQLGTDCTALEVQPRSGNISSGEVV